MIRGDPMTALVKRDRVAAHRTRLNVRFAPKAPESKGREEPIPDLELLSALSCCRQMQTTDFDFIAAAQAAPAVRMQLHIHPVELSSVTKCLSTSAN
jgi:hypothetical protein